MVFGLKFSAFMLCAMICLFVFVGCNEKYSSYMEWSYPLVSINLASNTEGSLTGAAFIGSGAISGQAEVVEYYYYQYTREDGGKIINKVDASHSVVYEVESEFHIEAWCVDRDFRNSFSGILHYEYRFFVPKNSIVPMYKIDLKDLGN